MTNQKHKILYTQKQIEQRISVVAKQINRDYKNKKPIVIALLKGCIPFFGKLFLQLTCNPTMDFIVVSSYRGARQGEIKLVTDLHTNIQGRDIILVDDIIDSGRTLDKVTQIFKTRNFKSLKIACLLLRNNSNPLIKPDYVCLTTNHHKDDFIIGYGLDYSEQYRNLPYMAVMNKKLLLKSTK